MQLMTRRSAMLHCCWQLLREAYSKETDKVQQRCLKRRSYPQSLLLELLLGRCGAERAVAEETSSRRRASTSCHGGHVLIRVFSPLFWNGEALMICASSLRLIKSQPRDIGSSNPLRALPGHLPTFPKVLCFFSWLFKASIRLCSN